MREASALDNVLGPTPPGNLRGGPHPGPKAGSVTNVRHLEEGDRARVAHMQQQAFVLPPERIAIAGNYALEEGWVVELELV